MTTRSSPSALLGSFSARLRSSTPLSGQRLGLAMASALSLTIPQHALANPLGGQVAAGSATISQPDSTTLNVNQGSDKAIINWQDFDIEEGETTNFNQPTGGVALNRVTGG